MLGPTDVFNIPETEGEVFQISVHNANFANNHMSIQVSR